MKLLPESRFRAPPSILQQETGGTVVLLTLDEGRYYALEEVAGRAWLLCDGQRTVSQMAALLAGEYDAPPAEIERDLLELFADMVNENLLVENSPTAAGA